MQVVAHEDPTLAVGPAADATSEAVPGQARAGGPLSSLLPAELLAGVNWIDAAHHNHGTMGLRWVLAKGSSQPRCRLVALGPELAAAVREAAAS